MSIWTDEKLSKMSENSTDDEWRSFWRKVLKPKSGTREEKTDMSDLLSEASKKGFSQERVTPAGLLGLAVEVETFSGTLFALGNGLFDGSETARDFVHDRYLAWLGKDEKTCTLMSFHKMTRELLSKGFLCPSKKRNPVHAIVDRFEEQVFDEELRMLSLEQLRDMFSSVGWNLRESEDGRTPSERLGLMTKGVRWLPESFGSFLERWKVEEEKSGLMSKAKDGVAMTRKAM